MPFIRLQTNTPIEESANKRMLRGLSSLVAGMLNKPERYVMVSLETDHRMLFGGSDEPLAYIELKSIGLPGDQTRDYSATLCRFVSRELNISEERIYIEFADAQRHLWGWNAGTFER